MSNTRDKQIILVETRNPLEKEDKDSLIYRVNEEINSKEGFNCSVVYLPHVVHDDQSFVDMVISNSLVDLRVINGVSIDCVVCFGFDSCMVEGKNKKVIQMEKFDSYVEKIKKVSKHEKTATQASKIISKTISKTAVQLIKYRVSVGKDMLFSVSKENGVDIRNAGDFNALVGIICGVL